MNKKYKDFRKAQIENLLEEIMSGERGELPDMTGIPGGLQPYGEGELPASPFNALFPQQGNPLDAFLRRPDSRDSASVPTKQNLPALLRMLLERRKPTDVFRPRPSQAGSRGGGNVRF